MKQPPHVPRPQVIRLPAVLHDYGYGRSTVFKLVSAQLWPRPIKLTARSCGWIVRECDAVLAARIRGADDDAIRKLVLQLEVERMNAGVAAA